MDKDLLKIKTSISKTQIIELIDHSANDQDVIKNTSDSTRFKSRKAFDKWVKSNPSIYVLTDKTEKLLGLVWVQRMDNPLGLKEFDTTAAIRLYGEARGRGLSSWFFDEALKRYGDSNYWLRASSDNYSAIKTYQRLGFTIVSSPDKENKIILVRHSTGN